MPIETLKYGDTAIEQPWLLRRVGFTEAQFLDLVDEDTRWELIDGEIIMHSPAKPEHEREAMWLGGIVTYFVEKKSLGAVFGSALALRLGPDRIVSPDIVFISAANAGRIGDDLVNGPADWVCEVTSPSSRAYDLGEKRALYKAHGVEEIVVVDLQKKMLHTSVRRPGGDYSDDARNRGRVDSTVIPGFWVDAEWLWQRPLPPAHEVLDRILSGGAS